MPKSKKSLYPISFVLFAVFIIASVFLIKYFWNYRNNPKKPVLENIKVEGTVTKNFSECYEENDCYITVQTEKETYDVVYLSPKNECGNKLAPGMAYESKEGDRLQIFGQKKGNGKMTICGSEEYFIKKL